MDENNNNVNEVPNEGTTEPKAADPVTPKEEPTTAQEPTQAENVQYQPNYTPAPETQYQPTPPPNPQDNPAGNANGGGKGAGIASLILGIFSLVLAPWGLVAVLALILGIVGMILAIVQNKKNKTGVATGGLITSIFGMVISIIVLIACVACTALLRNASNSVSEELSSYNYNSIFDYDYDDDDEDEDDSFYNRYSSLANTIMQQTSNTISSQMNTTTTNTTTSSATPSTTGAYYVKGQTYTDDEWVITLTDVDLNYTNYSTYSAPSDGNKVVRATFDIQYLGSGSEYVTQTDFDCYADSYSCSSFYGEKDEDRFRATISTGKKAIGSVYFTVPTNATEITVEFETDWLHDEYATFKLQ